MALPLTALLNNTAVGSICYCIDNQSTSYDVVLNIKGGTIKKNGTAVRMFCNSTTKNNSIIMDGGTIEGATTAFWVQLPGSSGQAKRATIKITGGTIKGETYSFYDYSFGDIFDAVSYTITGGTFVGEEGIYSCNVRKFISGGTFGFMPSNDYLAEGYTVIDNSDGTYTVVSE